MSTATLPRVARPVIATDRSAIDRVWLVGIADDKSISVPEELCSGWTLVGVFDERRKAINACASPRHFFVPVQMNRGPSWVDTVKGPTWTEVEYPRWNGPMSEILIRRYDQ